MVVPAEAAEIPGVDPPTKLVRPPPKAIDVAARLNDPIPEIEFSKISLNQFLQFVTDFSTIPVTLDPEVLSWLDLTPATPVSISQRDTNVAKLLTEVLVKIGLNYQVVNGHLLVTRNSASVESKRKTKLYVADLAGSDPSSLPKLREDIVELIAPESWDEGLEERGTLTIDGTNLVVEQRDDVLFEIIALCERLRVARGLPTRGKFSAKNFQITTRIRRAHERLAKPLTLNYSRPTSLVKILNRISEESGVHMLVDWMAVAEAGWNPDAEVTFTIVNQPLDKSLDVLLKPMELVYRIVDENVIQVTTPLVLDERLELEIYPVSTLFGPDASIESVQQRLLEIAPPEWFRSGGGRGAIRYDAPSQSLLVSLSQPRHRQFEQRLAAAMK